jgi:hypothetical protein
MVRLGEAVLDALLAADAVDGSVAARISEIERQAR